MSFLNPYTNKFAQLLLFSLFTQVAMVPGYLAHLKRFCKKFKQKNSFQHKNAYVMELLLLGLSLCS